MNEAIVWALDRAFPAPITIEEKLDELANLVATLKGDDTYHLVDKLVDEITDTIEKVSNYKIKAQPNFRDAVKDRYERLLEEEYERMQDYHAENPFDDDDGGDPFIEVPLKDIKD